MGGLREFWIEKLTRNRSRDLEVVEKLLDEKWRVLWIWQCALSRKAEREALPEKLKAWIEGDERFGEIAGVGTKPTVLSVPGDSTSGFTSR